MNHKYEVGMQCLIVGARTEEGAKDIGKVVELVEFIPAGASWSQAMNNTVVVEKYASWVVRGEGLLRMYYGGSTRIDSLSIRAQRYLLPLKGDDFQNELYEDELLEFDIRD